MRTSWDKMPLGKKKTEFVKWLMQKHKVSFEDAKLLSQKVLQRGAARNAASI